MTASKTAEQASKRETIGGIFESMEAIRHFCEENDEMMELAVSAAKEMDADDTNLYKAGTFHGICQAIATTTGVSVSFVEETVCEFADVAY